MRSKPGARPGLGLKEPIAVLGVGVEGVATIDFLLRQGAQSITALDRRDISDLPPGVRGVFGEGYDRDLQRFATVFRSPGIRPDHPALEAARSAGTWVTSAVAYFLATCPAPVVGVTGTVGKGTTASLIARMLKESGFTVHLGGNIGLSPLAFLDTTVSDHRVVLEISSFQAMDLTVSPHVGVILKTTSEHLDWHSDLDEYLNAKARLIANQSASDIVIYNKDAPHAERVASASPSLYRRAYSTETTVEEGLYYQDGDGFIFEQEGQAKVLPVDMEQIRLPGRFNLENIAAAILAAHAMGGSLSAACRVAMTFEGLPHRLEFVASKGDIHFYNDSYATRPEATLAALSHFEDSPLAIILGGSEKHADFSALVNALLAHPSLKQVCLIGDTAGRIAQGVETAGRPEFCVRTYPDLEPAMEGAVEALDTGGVVLLAPACASFGLFPNYKVRGERFRAKARALADIPPEGGP
ncbi:MAG: UDP-N-acetylmuramoyl-L-alanine--D-glutamate ligase [Myxococcota bacterium]|nr:UDP-N-acetylmuramoyl-L-alanine--D-glutamate ligase [Myxococcota bacterium]